MPLNIDQILRWADAHQARTGEWPTVRSGEIPGSGGETWHGVYQALYRGYRGLPGGSSLAQLLAEHRGVRNRMDLPPLTKKQILAWAEAHHRRTGKWPTQGSGPVADVPGETWRGIHNALVNGHRGLPGGETLARLLVRRRGVRNVRLAPPLKIPQILKWADAHYRRYREWPKIASGRIVGTFGETWHNIDAALRAGCRGLPGGSSLPRLLAEYRGAKNASDRLRLTIKQILTWADAHYERTGSWPQENSGPIAEAQGETWAAVSMALRTGSRGLPGGSSLAKLLAERRGHRNPSDPPRLTIKKILAWADDHHRRTGKWPIRTSGDVLAQPGENWERIDQALRQGLRGLRGRSSLAQLLQKRRGRPTRGNLRRLTIKQILAWAEAPRDRTGEWPTRESGDIEDAPGETWQRIDTALQKGYRGLKGGSSLPRLLAEHRGYRNRSGLPSLSIPQILRWADAYRERTGKWPNHLTGPVNGVPGETWGTVHHALVYGTRGLPAGLSLAQLLADHRGVRNIGRLRALSESKIIHWAETHHHRTGRWPTRASGEIPEAPGETWAKIDRALANG